MTLKMLTMFPSATDVTVIRDDSGWACRTELNATVSAWDAAHYSHAATVIMIDGTSDSLIRQAILESRHEDVVFKVHDDAARDVLTRELRFVRMNSFESFTSHDRYHPPTLPTGVEVESGANDDPEAMGMFCASGYTTEEFASHAARGSRWFGVRRDKQLVSFCMAYQNYERIWEIGAVLTKPDFRGRGFAKAVVSAALQHLVSHDRAPRYQFAASNDASRGLALSLGLTHVLTVDHYAPSG